MSEQKPKDLQPAGKICEMIFSHDVESQKLKDLNHDPVYICSQCGNTAAHEENLCRPEKM
jgi:hypothetical protein